MAKLLLSVALLYLLIYPPKLLSMLLSGSTCYRHTICTWDLCLWVDHEMSACAWVVSENGPVSSVGMWKRCHCYVVSLVPELFLSSADSNSATDTPRETFLRTHSGVRHVESLRVTLSLLALRNNTRPSSLEISGLNSYSLDK